MTGKRKRSGRARGRGSGRGRAIGGNLAISPGNKIVPNVPNKPEIDSASKPGTTPANNSKSKLFLHTNPNLKHINCNSPVRTVEFKSGIGMSVKTIVNVQPQGLTTSKPQGLATSKPQGLTTSKPQVVSDDVIEKVVNASPKASALQGCCEYALLVTEDIRRSIVMGTPHTSARQRLYRRDFWHKFVITNGCKYYKDFILKLILEQLVYPYDLIPVMYQKKEPNTFFYARNCSSAVEKLCRLNFMIPTNPQGVTSSLQQPIVLQLVLAALPLSEIPGIIQEKAIQNALEKRYNISAKKTLNLKDFHNDVVLSEVVFLPLSQPNIMHYVMNYAKSGKYINAESISLADNELSNLKSLEILWNFKSLRILNLGYNKIASVDELLVLKDFPLTELVLDNNPLCQAFTNEAPYVKRVTEIIPTLKILDGCVLGNSSGMPQVCRNFLISPDGGPLTDQFLQHYFTLYDGSDRRKLLGIYHPEAIFSMTAIYLPGQSTSANARLSEYMVHSRNLQKLSDYSKAQDLMISGAESIIRHLCQMPKTWHDPHSFTVDLANYSVENKFASLMVCGVFREPNGLVRAFTRTFLLTCVAPDEWQIANEMYHVTNARTDDAKRAFGVLREPAALPNVTVLNRADREQMTEILSQLTDMNKSWATKCLEDMKWDFKDALVTFTILYKLGKVPVEAFDK